MEFNGMVKVKCTKAEKGALNCICFIERRRNAYFEKDVQYNMRKWTWADVMFKDSLWWKFIKGQRGLTREEAVQWTRDYHGSGQLFSTSYEDSRNILRLLKASDNNYIYLTPVQSHIINIFHNVDVKDIDADFNYLTTY